MKHTAFYHIISNEAFLPTWTSCYCDCRIEIDNVPVGLDLKLLCY